MLQFFLYINRNPTYFQPESQEQSKSKEEQLLQDAIDDELIQIMLCAEDLNEQKAIQLAIAQKNGQQ